MKKLLIAFLSLIIIAPAMSAPTQSTNASKTKTDSLQTKINVQVLYADRVPVKDMNIYYAQDINDLSELSKNSNLPRYQINGDPQTDSDGKVTFYTGKRIGLVATSGVVTPIEQDAWRTTRIMLTTLSPDTSNRKGSDGDSSQQVAECTPDEKGHLGKDAYISTDNESKGKCVKKSSLAETTITISGTVKYPDGSPAQDVYLMPYGEKPTTLNSAKSLSNGSFTISYFPKNKQLVAQFLTENDAVVNYDTISKDPNNVKVEIKSSIDESLIKSDCMNAEQKKKLHALAGKWLEKDKTCVPDECESERYELLNQGTLNATCEDQVGKDCAPENDNLATTGKYAWKNNELTCETNACFDGYTVKDGVCEPTDPTKDRTGENCTTRELQAQDKNATAGTVLVWTEQKVTCTITGCADGWDTDLSNSKCIQSTCKCGNQWNKALKKCEPLTDKNCTNTVVGATNAEWDCDENGNSYCKITACDTTNGYELADNKCECAMGFEKNQDGKCTPKMLLTKDQYQQEIKDLSDNAQKMRDNENSLVNKTIGAAGMGVTGAGGMMLAQSLSETMSDANAERTMAAYLQTFKCDYGTGTQIKGGETNIELPGGNDMIGLYTEYATLANDLKTRKEALGIRPGIESEVVIDKSETGLYDDVGTGITGGGYASIARALQDPEGEDAAKWAAQKETTKNTLIAGAVTTGVGAVGSLAANIAVNHNVKNDVDEIKQRYAAMKQPFKQIGKAIEDSPREKSLDCSKFENTTGKVIGNDCECSDTKNMRFLRDKGGCYACEHGKQYDKNNECNCLGDTPEWNGKQCVQKTQIETPVADAKKPSEKPCRLNDQDTLKQSGSCACVSNAEEVDYVCKCKTGWHPDGSECKKDIDVNNELGKIEFGVDNLFRSSIASVDEREKQKIEQKLKEFNKTASEQGYDFKNKDKDYCVVVVGKTDRSKFNPTTKTRNNNVLSADRAKAVAKIMETSFDPNNIISYGIADADCPKDKYKSTAAECRRVDVYWLPGSCETNKTNTDDWIGNVAKTQDAINALTQQITSSNK